jgi:tRNA modification GTPase
VEIIDTAGLRDSADIVEREGIRRAKSAAQQADHILYVVDDVVGASERDQHYWRELEARPMTVVLNKVEVSGRKIGETNFEGKPAFAVSALERVGIPELRRYLKGLVGFTNTPGQGVFLARRRHIDALSRTRSAVSRALDIYNSSRAGEFIAEELRMAQYALNEITGNFDNEALLDRIFSNFCIGK